MENSKESYEKQIELYQEKINEIWDKNEATNLVEAEFTEEEADCLVSHFLNMGTLSMRVDAREDAMEYYSVGYFLAYKHFGEFDERTLKQSYNMACVDMFSENPEEQLESIRQLEYCYYDMREHLGETNQYTKIARKLLKKFSKNPDQLYKDHLRMRKMIQESFEKK